jgi:hypothetical protein
MMVILWLISYNKTSKAYKVYILALKRTVVRRDVRFEEDRAYKKSCGQIPVDEQCHEQNQELMTLDSHEQSAPKGEG